MHEHLLAFASKTASAFRMNGSKGIYAGIQPVILEDFGTFTRQLSWTDETGYFVTYRLAPLDSGKPIVQQHALESERRWNDLFPGAKERWREVVDANDPNTRITVFVQTGEHSI
jgi:hypothetical protein